MDPPTAGLWQKIPGYEGASDSEDEEEAAIKATAEERLAQIVEVLGDRYVDVPFLDFVPAPKPKDLNHASSHRSAPPRVWGPNGPTPAFRIEHTDAPIVRDTFLCNGFAATEAKDWMVQWSGPGMRDYAYNGLHEYQRVNHFPGSYELTRKDRMWRHLLEKAQLFGKGTFDFVPETFVLPEQLEQFLECYEHSEHLWIVKPHASSRGRGIFLLRDIEELNLDELMVVSRYIENPLLIQGLKFDLRVYVLVTGFEPLRAYVYREGLVRFAVSPYSTEEEHLKDAYRHLTNYSINKYARNFVENQELKHDNVGHKWSLSALLKHLKCVGVDVELMWARIHDLIIKTLLAVEPTISSKARDVNVHPTNCFEVYGFDVLVDEDLKPWLIEVNLSPSMQAESPLDWQIKSALLADVFNLVGVCQVDQQTISTSRLRSRFLQARDCATPMRRSSSMSTLRPGSAASTVKRSNEKGRDRDRSVFSDVLNVASEVAEPLLTGVNLDLLSELQLKTLAHALKEMKRRHNFIRLYPTRATVRRYAPLSDPRLADPRLRDVRLPGSPELVKASGAKMSASQLLVSLLFGPAPVRSDQKLIRRDKPLSATFRRGQQYLEKPEMAQRSAEAARSLSGKAAQRFLFMEYLVRVSVACGSLSQSEKAKICQSPSYSRLLSFHRQLKQRRQKLREKEDPEPGSDSEPELEIPGGSLIDDLSYLCRSSLDRLARDVWESEAMLHDLPKPPSEFGQTDCDTPSLENVLPPGFASSMTGQKVINGLGCLSAADLERFLSGSQCLPEFRLDLVAEDDDGDKGNAFRDVQRRPMKRPSSGVHSRRSRQDQDCRPSQLQAGGPLHDLLLVPRDYIDPAAMPGKLSPTGSGLPRRLQKFCSGEDGSIGTQARARASPSPEGEPSSSPSPVPQRSTSPHVSPSASTLVSPRAHASHSRPVSAIHRSSGARPLSGKRIRQLQADFPMNPAERANGFLTRSTAVKAIRSEPQLRFPVQPRRALAMSELAEALAPLRHRPSHCPKLRSSSPSPAISSTQGARPMPVPTIMQKGPLMQVPHFSMDIEL